MDSELIPFLLRRCSMGQARRSHDDENAGEDPLPPIVALRADGTAIARSTKVTAVEQETLDDR